MPPRIINRGHAGDKHPMSKSPTASAFNSAARGTASQQHVPMQRGGDQQSPVSHDSPNDPRNPNYQAYQQQQQYGGGGGDGGGGYPQPAGDGYGLEQQSRFWDADAGLDPSFDEHIADEHDVIDANIDGESEMSVSGGGLDALVQAQYVNRLRQYRTTQDAYAQGRFGFTFSLSQSILGGSTTNTSVQVLSMEMDASLATEWTLTLSGINYAAGDSTNVTGADPDHWAASRVNTDSSNAAGNFAVRLEWGVDGAYETATIDYPTRGASISLCAASIRVSIILPTSATIAAGVVMILSGFLTPAGKRQGSMYDAPTRTLGPFLVPLNAGTPVFVPIPDRARAYRVLAALTQASFQTVLSSGPLQKLQVDAFTGNTIFSNDTSPAGEDLSAEAVPQQQSVKLHPSAQMVKLQTGATGAAWNSVYLQFDLDLG